MRKGFFVVLALSSSLAAFAQVTTPAADDTPPWMLVLAQRHADLIEQNGPGTEVALQARLLAMRDEDQAAPERGLTKVAPENAAKAHAAANLHATDTRLTAELKAIVAKHGWPTIAMVGIDASNAAMLVLTHTRDHAWQRSLLPHLEELAKASKIDGSALAVVVDKELVAEGKLQCYGSQFKFQDGSMMMFAVEDPAELDHRRELALLMPLDVYKKMLSDMYHLPVSEMIVRAEAPAKATPVTSAKKPASKKPVPKKKTTTTSSS